MKTLYLSISAIFAATPGFSVMWKGIGTPPDYNWLFGGVIESFGALILLLLWMNRAKISKVNSKKIIQIAVSLGLLSFVSLIIYLLLFNLCVISHPTNHTVFFPLWTSGDLAILVQEAGGRWNALDQHGYFGIYSEISKMPFYALPLTVAVLIFFYQLIFSSLAASFGLIGFHKKEKVEIVEVEKEKRVENV